MYIQAWRKRGMAIVVRAALVKKKEFIRPSNNNDVDSEQRFFSKFEFYLDAISTREGTTFFNCKRAFLNAGCRAFRLSEGIIIPLGLATAAGAKARPEVTLTWGNLSIFPPHSCIQPCPYFSFPLVF